MKLLLLAVAVFIFNSGTANNYFFSTSTGDDSRSAVQAQNQATPWRTLNKLNALGNLNPGDFVSFKRGDTFYGSIPGYSGSIGSVITYNAYGSGANPVISGFTTLSSWTLSSGNIYYATLDVSILHGVTLDGAVKAMGRYPNTGYLTYTSHPNNTSISGTTIGALPFNATGGEVVVRKLRWILDRHPITSHSGNTISYNTSFDYGNSTAALPLDGNGYFIQGHLSTLDTEGDWYYNNAANRLYMHFGSGTPTGKTVKASTVNKIVWAGSYISFTNIDFEGGNYAITLEYNSNLTINNCNFRQQAASAIYGNTCSNITISGGSISNALNNAIIIEQAGSYVNITGLTVTNSGYIVGMGSSGDGSYGGIMVVGDNTTIANCSVTNVGFNSIYFQGSNVLVENNFVDTYCTVKDDGAGIYTYREPAQAARTNQIVRNNIILNGIGAQAGYADNSLPIYSTCGVYLDGASHYVTITDNTIAHSTGNGILINSNDHNSITNNTIYNCLHQLLIYSSVAGTINNNTITGNKFIARTSTQNTMWVSFKNTTDVPANIGTMNNNYYARPIDDLTTIAVDRNGGGGGSLVNMSLATWKSTYNQDAASNKSPVAITSNPEDIRFEYNATNAVKTFAITGSWVDIKNNKYSNTVSLQPFSSIVLLKTSTQGSSKNDKFRSRISGNWSDATSWQSSPDDITWIDATMSPTNEANSVTIQKGHSLDITDSVTIDQLLINNGAVLNIAPKALLIVDDGAGEDITIAEAGKMIIKSNSTGTGRIGNSKGTIKGNATVERYLPAHANARYQLLSASVNTTTTIKSNWQEGTNNSGTSTNNNPAPGYGTHITGSSNGANGFDATVTGQASLFTYTQSASQPGWTNIINTDANTLNAKNGYLLYVRGDRSFDIRSNSTQASNTTLRATGNVLMGTVTYLTQESNGRMSLIANPYASPIDWKKIQATNNSNFENYYTLWDPNIGSRGGYVTVDLTGTKSVITSEATTEIQSGQAFLVKSKAGVTSPSFTILEANKSTTNNINVFRSGQTINKLYASLFFRNTAQNRNLADGVLARFEENYASHVDGDDAEDIANFDENIALVRDGKTLSIESLPLSTANDTLFLKVNNLKQQSYEWQFDAIDFNSLQSKQPYLIDNYMGTETPIALTGTTITNFTVTNNPASSAVNRFTIVFKTSTALPVNILSVKGYKKNEGISIEWETAKEINMDRYEVERLSDRQTFISKSVVAAKNSSIINNYSWFDSNPEKGNNFYRIRAISKDGTIRYSLVVSVFISNEGKGMSVYPNPVRGKVFGIQLNNILIGTYTVNLINRIGQIISSHKIEHPGGSVAHLITANNSFISGTYTIQLTGENTTLSQQILKQ